MSRQDMRAFERLRKKLEATPVRQDQCALIADFLSGIASAPLIEGKQAVLLYRGRPGQDVRVTADWNGYSEPGQPLTEIAGSGLYFFRLTAEPDARLDYAFGVNPSKGGKLRLDPLNPRRVPGGYGARSVLAMPAYKPPRELADDQPVPAGRLTRLRLRSRALGQRRTLCVYTPADYPTHAPYPTIYLHDGGDYIRFARLPALADRLIAARRTLPFVAVCIPPRDRVIEYDCNEAYVQFVADEAIPTIERRFAVEARPDRRAVMGASFGGLISLYIGLRRSNIFGLVGGQSSYASRGGGTIVRAYASAPPLNLKIHLIAGTYESQFEATDEEGNFLEANRRLATTLRQKGYAAHYAEYPEGHSWGLWQAHLGDAIEYFFQKRY